MKCNFVGGFVLISATSHMVGIRSSFDMFIFCYGENGKVAQCGEGLHFAILQNASGRKTFTSVENSSK